MNKISNLLWGFLLIVVGVIFGLNALDITNINVFFDGWWCLFIIIPCFIDLFKEKNKTGNIIGVVIGCALFLVCQNFINFEIIFKLAGPFIVVVFGVSLLIKGLFNNNVNKKIEANNKGESRKIYAIFSGEKLNYSNERVDNINLNAAFGGIDVDLKDAIIDGDIIINTSCIFGGIDIKNVSDDIDVKVVSTSIFGGVSNKVSSDKKRRATIYINAICIFGGVDIK